VKRFAKLVLGILPLIVALFLLVACAAGPSDEQMALDMAPFLQMAEDAACADQRNQLYVIDDQFVFWATEGRCSDASYAYILYGARPDEKLCTLEDSIAGPRSTCQPDLQALFETIQQNLDHPNLGLDENHAVMQVMLGEE
jgi:hypothetical protein